MCLCLQNRGLGHSFLRHIERTKVIAYVLDCQSGNGSESVSACGAARELPGSRSGLGGGAWPAPACSPPGQPTLRRSASAAGRLARLAGAPCLSCGCPCPWLAGQPASLPACLPANPLCVPARPGAGRPGPKCWDQLDTLQRELAAYAPHLSRLPALVLANKLDAVRSPMKTLGSAAPPHRTASELLPPRGGAFACMQRWQAGVCGV